MIGLLIPFGYILGSISFSLLLVDRLQHRDLRDLGSGNPGATNVLRLVGKLPALLVLALDVAKGVIPIAIGMRLEAPGPVLGATAVAVVLGHLYPIFHGFRGGKGVATATGALGVLQPQLLLACGLLFLIALLVTRYVSLASMLGLALYPVLTGASIVSGRLAATDTWLAASSGIITLLVVWRHRANIARMVERSEPRLGGVGRIE